MLTFQWRFPPRCRRHCLKLLYALRALPVHFSFEYISLLSLWNNEVKWPSTVSRRRRQYTTFKFSSCLWILSHFNAFYFLNRLMLALDSERLKTYVLLQMLGTCILECCPFAVAVAVNRYRYRYCCRYRYRCRYVNSPLIWGLSKRRFEPRTTTELFSYLPYLHTTNLYC